MDGHGEGGVGGKLTKPTRTPLRKPNPIPNPPAPLSSQSPSPLSFSPVAARSAPSPLADPFSLPSRRPDPAAPRQIRGVRTLLVAASPPTEEAVQMTEPLTKDAQAFSRIMAAFYAVKLPEEYHILRCIEHLVGVRPPAVAGEPSPDSSLEDPVTATEPPLAASSKSPAVTAKTGTCISSKFEKKFLSCYMKWWIV